LFCYARTDLALIAVGLGDVHSEKQYHSTHNSFGISVILEKFPFSVIIMLLLHCGSGNCHKKGST